VLAVKPPPPPVGFARGNVDLLVSLIRAEEKLQWTSPALIDYWSSRPLPVEEWAPPSTTELRLVRSLVDRVAIANGYALELVWASVTHTKQESDRNVVINSEEEFLFYREFFASAPHENYLAPEGPCVVSVESRGRGLCSRAIVRLPTADIRVLLPADKPMRMLETFLPAVAELKFKKCKNPDIISELVGYEQTHCMHTNYKIGVLRCKPWEFDENALFGTQGGSPAYEEFLEFLGERITLEGWSKYRGGLDIKSNNTGTHSVYAELKSGTLTFQIMFHVATLLPFDPKDPQQIERKRHIGNDVVAIVFKEQADATDTFNPLTFTSHFIHNVFVITPEVDAASGKTTHYWLTVANKPGVRPYPPFIPAVARFEKSPQFRKFLLTKLINAERASLGGGEFQSIVTARRLRLADICQSFAV
jgi:hypothetical protein